MAKKTEKKAAPAKVSKKATPKPAAKATPAEPKGPQSEQAIAEAKITDPGTTLYSNAE